LKPKTYNVIAAAALAVLLAGASVVLAGVLWIGSAFRMANVNDVAVFTTDNFRSAIPLFAISAVLIFGMILGFIVLHFRRRG